MKILAFTDVHITPHGQFSVPTSHGSTSRLDDILNSFDWLASLIYTLKPNLVVNLGDWHQEPVIDPLTMRASVQCLALISESCKSANILFVLLPGNHDMLDEGIYCTDYMQWAAVLADRPLLLNGVNFIPYIKNLDYYRHLVHQVPNGNVLFTHQDFVGGMLNNHVVSDFGAVPDSFVGCRHVFVGHLHHPHDLPPNITFIGALMYNHFGDRLTETPRGALLYDTQSGQIKRFFNDRSPLFITLSLDASTEMPRLPPADKLYLRINYDGIDPTEIKRSLPSNTAGYMLTRAKPTKVSRRLLRNAVNFGDDYISNFKRYVDSYPPRSPLVKDIVVSRGAEIIRGTEWNSTY